MVLPKPRCLCEACVCAELWAAGAERSAGGLSDAYREFTQRVVHLLLQLERRLYRVQDLVHLRREKEAVSLANEFWIDGGYTCGASAGGAEGALPSGCEGAHSSRCRTWALPSAQLHCRSSAPSTPFHAPRGGASTPSCPSATGALSSATHAATKELLINIWDETKRQCKAKRPTRRGGGSRRSWRRFCRAEERTRSWHTALGARELQQPLRPQEPAQWKRSRKQNDFFESDKGQHSDRSKSRRCAQLTPRGWSLAPLAARSPSIQPFGGGCGGC